MLMIAESLQPEPQAGGREEARLVLVWACETSKPVFSVPLLPARPLLSGFF